MPWERVARGYVRLARAGVGLACFAPFICCGDGAGDVKLLAAVGAFLVLKRILCGLFSLARRRLAAIGYCVVVRLACLCQQFCAPGLDRGRCVGSDRRQIARRDRLPFALPIAIGGIALAGT